jgi:hypothetical protein
MAFGTASSTTATVDRQANQQDYNQVIGRSEVWVDEERWQWETREGQVMGSDAAVYVFDYERYVTEMVPAARHLLLRGEIAPWWEETIRAVEAAYGVASYTDGLIAALTRGWDIDLQQYCTYLSPDLGMLADQSDSAWMAMQQHQRLKWEARACPSLQCPIRHRCIFHRTQVPESAQPVEDFNQALAYAITARYVGEGQFVGRSRTPFDYQEYLAHVGVAVYDPIHKLWEHLGRRGFVVGYLFSNGDGIQGWLTPGESQDLRSRLDALPLPQYEATFPAMAEQLGAEQHRQPALVGNLDLQWEAVSLSFVRTVATIAVGRGQGLLWGNDLPTASPKQLSQRSL